MLACAVGLTWILMYGRILDKPRNFLLRWEFFRELLRCGLCTGMYSGAFVLIVTTLTGQIANAEYLLFPLASSAVSYIADLIFFKLLPEIHDHYIQQNNNSVE